MHSLAQENQLLKLIIVNKLMPIINANRRVLFSLEDLLKEEGKKFIPALLKK